jgi:hypothetical protein
MLTNSSDKCFLCGAITPYLFSKGITFITLIGLLQTLGGRYVDVVSQLHKIKQNWMPLTQRSYCAARFILLLTAVVNFRGAAAQSKSAFDRFTMINKMGVVLLGG